MKKYHDRFLMISLIGVACLFFVFILLFNTIPNFRDCIGIGVLTIICSIVITCLFDKYLSAKYSDRFWMLIFGIINLVSHMSYVFFISDKGEQISDFFTTYKVVVTGDIGGLVDYYRIAPHKYVYAWLLHNMGFKSQMSIQIFQAISVSATVVLLFLLAVKIRNQTAAFMACIYYTILLPRIAYISIIVEEHITVNIVLLLALLYIHIMENWNKEDIKKNEFIRYLIMTLLTGLLMGIGVFFKDWGTILFLAAVISLIIKSFKMKKEWIVTALLGFVFIFSFRFVTREFVLDICKDEIGVEVHKDTLPFYIYSTFYPTLSGGYDGEWYEYVINRYKNNDWNFEQTDKELMKEWRRAVAENKELVLPLIKRKCETAYGNISVLEDWSYNGLFQEWKDRFANVHNLSSKVNNGLFFSVMILAGICSMINIRLKNFMVLFINISLIGCFLSVAFMEGQGRYKYSLLALWFVLAGICAAEIGKYIAEKRMLNSIKNEYIYSRKERNL